MGEFEKLMADIEKEVEDAEGGWLVNDGSLIIQQAVSRDPSRSHNGGEYDTYKEYTPNGLGVEVEETWSCDIAPRSQYGGEQSHYDCIVNLEGLELMAKLADLKVAARAVISKEPGWTKKIQAALSSL